MLVMFGVIKVNKLSWFSHRGSILAPFYKRVVLSEPVPLDDRFSKESEIVFIIIFDANSDVWHHQSSRIICNVQANLYGA